MNIEKIKISKVKANPNNPRVIKDQKFKKLVQSIKDFPEMLKIRPIVVDKDNIVLGGNQRLRACQRAELKEVYIIKADELTEEQQREFMIKDNLGMGEWDWDELANKFDASDLNRYGLEVPELEEKQEIHEQEIEFSEYLDESHNYVVLLFDNDIDWLSAQTHFELKSVYSKRQNGKPWSKGIGRVINGAAYLKKLTDA
jgi:ParB-like chromosome segregation protein Spo0J